MHYIKLFFPMILMVALVGCTKVNKEEASMQLLNVDREFAQMSRQQGAAEAFKAYLAENALELPNGSHPINGRNSIYTSMQEGPEVTLLWEPQEAVVSALDDMGYTWGTYTASWKGADGSEKTSYGKYLNVWRKQDDGTWKVVVDMGNQSPPPAE